MKKYALTGTYTGVVFAHYSAQGTLLDLQTSQAELTHAQATRMFRNIPIAVEELLAWCASPTVKLNVVEVNLEVSFEMFYTTYGNKEGRKKAEASWNKLSPAEQLKAFLYIGQLKTKKKVSGEALPYPATYLNNARWND